VSKPSELFRDALRVEAKWGQPRLALAPEGKDRANSEILKVVQSVFLGRAVPPRLVVFTSVQHGNGCSWVCASVARALASQVRGPVCVIDANAGSSSLCGDLGIDNGRHIDGVALDAGPIPINPACAGPVYLMSGSALVANLEPSPTLEQLRLRVLELRPEFSFVLVDAPPVNGSPEALTWARLADGVILVLEANSTRREAARKAKETLEAAKVTLLGAVLNKRTFPIPNALYKRL
jgi:Mrp family chromosome partitioning ATPase